MTGRFARKMHRLHRWFGTALFVLTAIWFASGAVMTVAPFPRFTEEERLASDAVLPELESVPDEVATAVAKGERARLANVQGRATWIVGRKAYPAPRFELGSARRELEARFGAIAWIERLDELDQWSVPQRQLPLYRAGFTNGDQAYLAAPTGEIVQYTTRSERIGAWLGAIPHWVYFTWLRAQRELWRDTVLVLSLLGLIATVTGLIAGLSVQRKLKRTIREPVLRWHQRLGLAFGALAFTWLFSGALSLTPFQWTRFEPPRDLFVGGPPRGVAEAVQACRRELEVRTLELAPLAGRTYAVCASRDETRVVDLATGVMQRTLPLSALPGATIEHEPDAYFYPTHHGPPFPSVYLRLTRGGTTLYVDPARARVLELTTERLRLERWLYHGLHSFDLPGLYDRPWLWRGVIWLAMGVGFALSALGGVMAWRRYRPRPVRPR